MSVPINQLKGMTADLANALRDMGIKDSDALLAAAGTPAGRKELAAKLGVDTQTILGLTNRADLARVKGIGSVYGDLLEDAGVDTVKELAQRNPANLLAKMTEVNAKKNLAGRLPTPGQVEDWVNQAKSLPRAIEY